MINKLAIENVSKSFGNVAVLHDVSFVVRGGEFLSVLGPSGCGKTTLLRILIGLETPDSGKIFKDDADITTLPASMRKMGMVFQNYALFENMTALRNVEYALLKSSALKNSYNRATAREKAEEMLEIVGLEKFFDSKPSQLSGGQQQRVAIARTLALNPDIILFDEPMSALDVDMRLSLRAEIKELAKKFRTTMIYITHDQEEAFAMSDRIAIMNAGKIHQIDTPHNIIESPADDFVENFVIKNINIKINSLIHFQRKS